MPAPRRLYEQIARKLSKAIADGEYEIGQRLPSERDLAQTFAVSRPTVREAIISLELDGLVEVRLGSGVYVTHREPPDGAEGPKDIGFFELLEARRSIEGESCALAALRIDDSQLAQLVELVDEMRRDNQKNDVGGKLKVVEGGGRAFIELAPAGRTSNSRARAWRRPISRCSRRLNLMRWWRQSRCIRIRCWRTC